jgi:hypothetical protein
MSAGGGSALALPMAAAATHTPIAAGKIVRVRMIRLGISDRQVR